MRNARMTICLVAAVLLMAADQGFGWTQYKDGLTHNISSTINDDVWVDYQTPSMYTTVNLLTGGAIPNPYNLQGYNDSRINISGGSSVTNLQAQNSSQVTISAGWVSYLYTYNSSKVTMSGGSVDYLIGHDNGQVMMSDGQIYGVQARDSSYVTVSGGRINSYLYIYDNSQVTMSSGAVGNLQAYGNSQVAMSGGSVGDWLQASNGSEVTISGGIIGGAIQLGNQSILALDGTNFAIDGILFSSGEITSIFGGELVDEPFRRLTGTLTNGDIINNQFKIGETAKIVLIPEPATLLLLGLGAVMLRRKR